MRADDPRLVRLLRAAESYCAWVESDPVNEDCEAGPDLAAEEAARAFELVAEVVAASSVLRELEPGRLSEADDVGRPDSEAWDGRFRRLRTVGVGLYQVALQPLDFSDERLGAGDVCDDLTDLWRDLRHALSLLDAGRAADAFFQLRSMRLHWLAHATGALYALGQHFNETSWPTSPDGPTPSA